MGITYKLCCPYNWFPLTCGILAGGYKFTIGIGYWGGLFGLTTTRPDPSEPTSGPLWAKYIILVARKGTLLFGSYVAVGYILIHI